MSAIDDAIEQIELAIIANGNEEITADVLRPLLVGLAQAVKEEIGNPAVLDTTATDVVLAINEVKEIAENATGVVILTGNTDPNVTPPIGYSLGNYYSWYVDATLIGFYQYNGYEWVEIKTPEEGS